MLVDECYGPVGVEKVRAEEVFRRALEAAVVRFVLFESLTTWWLAEQGVSVG